MTKFSSVSHVTAGSADDEILFNWSQVTPADKLNEMVQYFRPVGGVDGFSR